MTDVRVVQPSELSTQDFVLESGIWKLVRPYVENQSENAITPGANGGAMLATSALKRYRLIPDNVASTLSLYEYFGDYFNQSTATLLDVVDLATVSVEVDDFEISDTVIHFKDVQSGREITFDTVLPIYEIFYRNSPSIQIQGTGKHSELVVDLIVDPDTNNLLKVTTQGAMVDSEAVISVMNNHIAQTLELELDLAREKLVVSLGQVTREIGTSRLLNSSGEVIGFVLST